MVVATSDSIMLKGHTLLPRVCPLSMRGSTGSRLRTPCIHESGPLEGGQPGSETGLTVLEWAASRPFAVRPEDACTGLAGRGASDGAERDDGVVAAETERVRDRCDVTGRQFSGCVADDVDPDDLRIDLVDVDGRGSGASLQRLGREDGLDGAGATEQVSGHRLRGRDERVTDVVAHELADRQRLGDVPDRGGRGVGVDVL